METVKLALLSILQAFSDESYSFPNRQYNNLVLPCEDGGNQKQLFNRISKRNVEISPAPWDHNYRRISSKLHKRGGRMETQSGNSFHKYFREIVRSKEDQRWMFLLLDCQHNFHGILHGNQIHAVRKRMQCSKSGPISTFMLSHLFQ